VSTIPRELECPALTLARRQLFRTQMFASEFASSSRKHRMRILVHDMATTIRSLSVLTTSLATTAAIYSLPLSSDRWEEEDAADLALDLAALPRLFKVSLALRGEIWNEFLGESPDGGRSDFIEWCYSKNDKLRPVEGTEMARAWSAPTSPAQPGGPIFTSITPNSHSNKPSSTPSPRRTHSSPSPNGLSTPIRPPLGRYPSGLSLSMEFKDEDLEDEDLMEARSLADTITSEDGTASLFTRRSSVNTVLDFGEPILGGLGISGGGGQDLYAETSTRERPASDSRYSRPLPPLPRELRSTPRGLRILSLDGGGIRGLPLLLTLRSILSSSSSSTPILPCEYFDLITGVSTGGLVALLLGRLRMSIDDAIAVYTEVASESFGAESGDERGIWGAMFSNRTGTSREERLERVLARFFPTSSLHNEIGGGESGCRVAVMSYRQLRGSGETHGVWHRSYGIDEDEPLTILQSARATLSASHFFKPYSSGDDHYTYTSTRTSLNPAESTLREVNAAFGVTLIDSFLSVGIGAVHHDPMLSPPSESGAKALKIVSQLSLDSSASADRFKATVGRTRSIAQLIRVNVDVGREVDAGVEEWRKGEALGEGIDGWVGLNCEGIMDQLGEE
jgi:hypothetical protein